METPADSNLTDDSSRIMIHSNLKFRIDARRLIILWDTWDTLVRTINNKDFWMVNYALIKFIS